MDLSGYRDDSDDLDAGDRAAAQLLTFFAASRAPAPTVMDQGTSPPLKNNDLEKSVENPAKKKKPRRSDSNNVGPEDDMPESAIFDAHSSNAGGEENFEDVDEPASESSAAGDDAQAPKKERKKRGPNKKGKNSVSAMLEEANPKPKRPMSAYNYFFQAERAKLSGNVEETSKVIGQRWKDLKTDKRRCFVALAEKDSKRYREELREYQFRGAAGPKRMSVDVYDEENPEEFDVAVSETGSVDMYDHLPDQAAIEKTLKRSIEAVPSTLESRPTKKPKKPLTAFNMFYKEEKPRFQGTDMDKTQVTELIGQKWLELEPLLRQKYEAFADKDAHRYDVESAAYENFKAAAKAHPVAETRNEGNKKESRQKEATKKELSKKENPKKEVTKKDPAKKEALKKATRRKEVVKKESATKQDKVIASSMIVAGEEDTFNKQEKKPVESKKLKKRKEETEKVAKQPTAASQVVDLRSEMETKLPAQAPVVNVRTGVSQNSIQGDANRLMPQRAPVLRRGNPDGVAKASQAAPRLASAQQNMQNAAQNEAESLARLMASASNHGMNTHLPAGQDLQNMLQLRALMSMQGGFPTGRPPAPTQSAMPFNSLLRGGFPAGAGGFPGQHMAQNAIGQNMQQMLNMNAMAGQHQPYGARQGDPSLQALLPLILAQAPADLHPSQAAV
jgi:hypothetical protein